jgi:ribonuclease HI
VKLFFDGGCRGIEGRLATAVVTGGRTTIVTDMGCGTSGDAEWLALIQAVTIARELELTDFVLLGDSADVVAKASGMLRCQGGELRHLEAFRSMSIGLPAPRVRRIKRSQNLAGIALARLHGR